MDTITIKVDPSGKGDFTTINDALDSVEAVNDNIPVRIELAPGEYYERLEIIRPHVTLVGENPDTTYITHSLLCAHAHGGRNQARYLQKLQCLCRCQRFHSGKYNL